MEVGNLIGGVDGCGSLQGLGLDLRHLFESHVQVLRGEVGELRPLIVKPEMRALTHDEHQPLRAFNDNVVLLYPLLQEGVDTLDVLGQRHLATTACRDRQNQTDPTKHQPHWAYRTSDRYTR